MACAIPFKLLEKTSEKNKKDDSRSIAFYDLSKLRTRYQLWMDNLPNIKPFYAVKSNNNPLILEYLASLGAGFDCASQSEIEAVLSLGVSPENIVFANTCKYESHIEYSAVNNVSLMTFDNEPELHKICNLYPTARLLIRIKSDAKDSLWKLGEKFGCTVSEARSLLQVARNLNLNVIGVSFHVGGSLKSSEGHCTAIIKAREVFEYVKGIAEFNFTHLDIGGGFAGSETEDSIFIDIAKEISKTIEEQFKDYQNLTVISEPGTFFCKPCVTIATRIIGKKAVMDSESHNETKVYYMNDGGLHGNLYYLSYIEETRQICSAVGLQSETYPSIIHGLTTEDETDKSLGPEFLPNMEVGDWLLFLECGCYNTSVCRKRSLSPKVIYYKDNVAVFPRKQDADIKANDGPTIHDVPSGDINDFISEQIYKAATKSSPIGFCNLSKIEARYRLWTKYLPANVKPFYAIKSNSDPVVLNHVASLGIGFECGTQEGIETVMGLGVSPINTIIAATCKPTSHIKYAAERNIYQLMTFDLETELHKIVSLHPTAELLINISPTAVTEDSPSIYDGCSISESLHLLQIAQSLGLHVVGVRFSFHVINHSHLSVKSYQTAITKAYRVFQQARTVGFSFNILDIGEGFTGNEDDNDLFIEIAESINKCVEEQFRGYPNLTILAEPGKFFVAPCLTIATQIHSKRPVTSDNATVFYYINDGFFGSFGRTVLYGELIPKPFPLLKVARSEELIPCTIWGPALTNIDKLGSFDLPSLDVGDYLLFNEMGAYSTVSNTRFNGLAGDIDMIYFTEKYMS